VRSSLEGTNKRSCATVHLYSHLKHYFIIFYIIDCTVYIVEFEYRYRVDKLLEIALSS
jgi:hypothetical protein